MHRAVASPLNLALYPYDRLTPVTGGREQLRLEGRDPGSLLVWQLGSSDPAHAAPIVRRRPGGLPLVVVLPRPSDMRDENSLLALLDSVRPQGILPYHPEMPSMEELTRLLTLPPDNIGAEVTDYLAWRGLAVDRETTRLIRKTVEYSANLRSVASLCRALYLSRRALGRRFTTRGLPVPSHWLHFARLLRVTIRLQGSEDSVLSAGYRLGYPDAFSLSNQMLRLTGFRPSQAREYLGWEWFLEAWLRKEADAGSLAPDVTHLLLADRAARSPSRSPSDFRRLGSQTRPDRAAPTRAAG